ncbi:2'-5' RNA ligase, partial [Mangrovactinospora gilvigrisea]
MRLFVAVLPPEEAVRELGSAVSRLKGLPPGPELRWTAREGWHLTLAFLGEVDEDRLPALEAGLAEEAARRSPLTLRLAGGGRFGGTVLWAGVEGDRAALGGLAAGVAEAVREAGLTVDDRPYTPHLT